MLLLRKFCHIAIVVIERKTVALYAISQIRHLLINRLFMNKFYITVPKPCHENWEGMTPAEQGRFCGSCQKTVIDFTNMSDRELVAYFKKPAESMCGRFYPDQLDREVAIPKKRIPWLKYFFTVTWPAFMLFLKSCNSKERIAGRPEQTNNRLLNATNDYTISGLYNIPMVAPVNSINAIGAKEKIVVTEVTMGKLEPYIDTTHIHQTIMGEIAAVNDTAAIDTAKKEPVFKQLDTVAVVADYSRKVMGAMSIVHTIYTQPEIVPLKPEKKPSFSVYPNPVRTGSSLTIQLVNQNEAPENIYVMASSGQLIAVRKLDNRYSKTVRLTIPNNLATGIYFIQMRYANGRVEKTSVMITR
jgi:hypothetical protein